MFIIDNIDNIITYVCRSMVIVKMHFHFNIWEKLYIVTFFLELRTKNQNDS